MIIYVWPDGSWAYPEELDEMNYKSDDMYAITAIPDEMYYEEIDEHVHSLIAEGCL